MFSSQYFIFPLSVPFHNYSIPIHSPTTHTKQIFSPSTSVSPCQYHSINVPYKLIHIPPTLYNVYLPVLQFSSVSTIPPMLHTHLHLPPTLYNIFLSVLQFSPLRTIPPLLHTHLHLPPTLYNVFLPVFPVPPVSKLPPLLHSHSFTYHPHYIILSSQCLKFPLSVPFHHCSIHIHSSTTHTI